MTSKPLRFRSLMLACALSSSSAIALAGVYRCTDAFNKVTYQEQPCPGSSEARSVNLPTPSATQEPLRPRRSDALQPLSLEASLDAPRAAEVNEKAQLRPTRDTNARIVERPAVPEAPRVHFTFDLLSIDGKRLPWSNTGPKNGKRQVESVLGGSLLERANGAAVLIRNGAEAYSFGGTGSTLRWSPRGLGKESQELKPPPNLPEFFMGYGLALDQQSGILGVVTQGDQGYFYRYDTKNHAWLSARPLQDRGILSIAFDSKTRTYVGISQYGKLVIFNDLGEVQREQALAHRLVDFRSTFDRGIPHADGLSLALHEGAVAIINIRKAGVTHIWTHELGSDSAQLTYKAKL